MTSTNSKIVEMPALPELEQQAAIWMMRIEEGLNAEREREFQSWLSAKDLHRTVFERVSQGWLELDVLESLNDVAEHADIQKSLEEVGREQHTGFLPSFMARALVIGSAVAAGIVAMVSLTEPPSTAIEDQYLTSIGEQRNVSLPDGSTMILNTNSNSQLHYNDQSRTIFLRRGQAFFDVKKDASRPFIVKTPKGDVQAIGTAFSVSIIDDQLQVVVQEGRVALTPNEGGRQVLESKLSDSEPIELTAGHITTFVEFLAEPEIVDLAEIERQLDWRDGVIGFRGESLEDVVQQISPYTDFEIQIDGEALKNQPIGGYFKIGETEALFDALALMANVKVDRLGPDRVRLYRSVETKTE